MAIIRHRLTPAVLALAMLTAPAIAIADEDDHSEVSHSGTFEEDLFASGHKVTITAEVDGGVIVMGGEVEIRSNITGDVVSSGGPPDHRRRRRRGYHRCRRAYRHRWHGRR